MSDVVIKAENLGKKYTMYRAKQPILVSSGINKDLVSGKPIIQVTPRKRYGRKDLNFEIKRGEAVISLTQRRRQSIAETFEPHY